MAAPATCVDEENDAKVEFEMKLAQALAGNEKKKRDRAVKKLERWLQARAHSALKPFNKDDMLRVWKGLHYCMWMSDKPVIQEDLAERISGLVHVFQTEESMLLWLGVFLETEAREWHGIDRLRLDKFMMMIRYVLRQSLGYLKRLAWPDELIQSWTDVVFQNVLATDCPAPNGFKMHIMDLFHDELTLVGADDLTSEKITLFLRPFCEFYSQCRSAALRQRLENELFMHIIQTSPVGMSDAAQRWEVQLKVDYKAIADELFKLASSPECVSMIRRPMYNLVKKYKDLAMGVFPSVELSSGEDEDIDDEQIEAATADLCKFETNLFKVKKKKKKDGNTKKKKSEIENDEIGDTNQPQNDDETKPKKKKKKRKRSDSDSVPEEDVSPLKKARNDENTPAEGKMKKKKKKKFKNKVETKAEGDNSRTSMTESLNLPVEQEKLSSKKKNKKVKPSECSNDTSTTNITENSIHSEPSSEKKKKRKNKDSETPIEAKKGGGDAEAMSFVSTEIPKAKFFKKAAKNKDKGMVTTPNMGTPSSAKKRVMFKMNQNRAQEFKESLTVSPILPFNPKLKPEQGILKSPGTPKPKVKVTVSPKLKATPKIRKPPSTFTPTLIPAPDKKKKKRKNSL